MTSEIDWPEGATHRVDGKFKKWEGQIEYSYTDGRWEKAGNPWTLGQYLKERYCWTVVERPAATIGDLGFQGSALGIGKSEPIEPYKPVVGDVVEAFISEKWVRADVYGIGENGECLAKPDGYWYDEFIADRIRPIKTEQERFIEKAMKATNGDPIDSTLRDLFDDMFHAGFKGPDDE